MLSEVFKDIYYGFYDLAYRFLTISNWFYGQGWPWSYLGAPFNLLYSIARAIGAFFYDAYKFTQNIETILDDAWSKAKQAFDYAYDVLRVKVNDALNAAADAWDRAVDAYHLADDAWDYAKGWLRDKAVDAYNKAVWAYEQIAVAVTAASQEIYAWVKAIPAEIKAFVDGVVADIGAVTVDIVQALINNALAAIAAPINLITLWFDDIQDFFNSPLDWLLDKFGDWFFGPEK